ncbi:MAG TPA: aldo/keto reductase [Anaerolineae bacterium]|nr:aldo/keto reductase [Anaerolineae bacterium]HNU03675.1 aldo/keto reductase [Anaerolineae bacterium]
MTTRTIPTITLHNGMTIPQLGFGTLNIPPDRNPTPENSAKTAQFVAQALEYGYRHIDTAQMYGNERGVGQGVAASGIARAQLFVTSKLGNGNHRPDDVRRSFDETMQKLNLEYLDLFLIHWPLPTLYDGDYVSTWKAMTELLSDGRVRSVGVSNFQPDHLQRIIGETGITPVVNQIEVHPGFNNDAARAACASHGIAVEAWSPLGQGKVLGDAVIGEVAARTGKTPAQVILRWHIQHGHIVIPKSMHWERMQENLALFDFDLSPADVAAIDALDRGESGRIGPNPDTFDWIPSGAAPRPTVGS